jgi:ubiquitin-like 1-activating enzyme E1 B
LNLFVFVVAKDAFQYECPAAQEIANLRKEALAFKSVRESLRSPSATHGDAAKIVFQKVRTHTHIYILNLLIILILILQQVFNADILNLLSMEDMWRSRAPPVPLDFDAIMENNFVLGSSNTTTNGTPHAPASNVKAATKSKSKSKPKKSVPASLSNKRQTRSSSRLAAASGSKTTEKLLNGVPNANSNGVVASPAPEGLKDQRKLSLRDNLELFVAR